MENKSSELEKGEIKMMITCFNCGYRSKRTIRPKNFRCPICGSGSYQWDLWYTMTAYGIRKNNEAVKARRQEEGLSISVKSRKRRK